VVHQVREEAIEDLKSSIDLQVLITVDEGEEDVKKVLPYIVLLFINSAANFNEKVADFVYHILVLNLGDDLEKLALNIVLTIRRKALPQVGVVVLVCNIL
jgi:hypothetical protein